MLLLASMISSTESCSCGGLRTVDSTRATQTNRHTLACCMHLSYTLFFFWLFFFCFVCLQSHLVVIRGSWPRTSILEPLELTYLAHILRRSPAVAHLVVTIVGGRGVCLAPRLIVHTIAVVLGQRLLTQFLNQLALFALATFISLRESKFQN
uniref:GH18009p n=1 Tax=Drosophila melanogaster TaxID=7227 RepID=Q8MRE9_DROME|nr:GH18009p [Drosophila melanogaster]